MSKVDVRGGLHLYVDHERVLDMDAMPHTLYHLECVDRLGDVVEDEWCADGSRLVELMETAEDYGYRIYDSEVCYLGQYVSTIVDDDFAEVEGCDDMIVHGVPTVVGDACLEVEGCDYVAVLGVRMSCRS